MSLESYPSREQDLQALAERCKAVLAQEDWEDKTPEESLKFESVQLCEQLASDFALRHHVLRRSKALNKALNMDEDVPLFLNKLVLRDPLITIRAGRPNGDDVSFETYRIPVYFMDIILLRSTVAGQEDYVGPHLIAKLDTNCFAEQSMDELGITPGIYTCIAPFNSVRVSEDHETGQFN